MFTGTAKPIASGLVKRTRRRGGIPWPVAPSGPARSSQGISMSSNRRLFLRGMDPIIPRLDTRLFDDLHYLSIRASLIWDRPRDPSEDLDGEGLRAGVLALPAGERWLCGKRIIRDIGAWRARTPKEKRTPGMSIEELIRFYSQGHPGDAAHGAAEGVQDRDEMGQAGVSVWESLNFYRHVLFGNASKRSVQDFMECADHLGSCYVARPTSQFSEGGLLEWLNCIAGMAWSSPPGSPLQGRVSTDLYYDTVTITITLSCTVFQASLWTIDAYDHHADELYGDDQRPQRGLVRSGQLWDREELPAPRGRKRAGREPTNSSRHAIKEPTTTELLCYIFYLDHDTGMRRTSQEKVARLLEKWAKEQMSRSSVSRAVDKVKRWLAAGNLFLFSGQGWRRGRGSPGRPGAGTRRARR
jgi:hypothetical protein